jgi:hypothetical protein
MTCRRNHSRRRRLSQGRDHTLVACYRHTFVLHCVPQLYSLIATDDQEIGIARVKNNRVELVSTVAKLVDAIS